MDKCVLYTVAYNADKTIERTIKSVLSLSVHNWVWYLLDNGATDSTGEIIKQYALMDSRIIPLKNKQNRIWEQGNKWPDFIRYYDNDDYFFRLDADDEYKPEFLDKMLRFISDYNLDVAVCGNDFIDAKNGTVSGVRKLDRNLILDTSEAFSVYFPAYHQFMRTYWCKLIKMSVMRSYSIFRASSVNVLHGGDTVFATEVFRNAARIGILADSLHKYYVSPTSVSYQKDNHRIISDRILDDWAREYLIDKCGVVSLQNNRFLQLVFLNAEHDTLAVLLNSDLSWHEKLQNLHNMVTHEKTQILFNNSNVPDAELNKCLRIPITNWLLSLKETRINKESANMAAEILSIIHIDILHIISVDCLSYTIWQFPELVLNLINQDCQQIIKRLNEWYKRHGKDHPLLTELEIAVTRKMGQSDDVIFLLFAEIKNQRSISAKHIDIDSQIIGLISKYPLLKNANARLACHFPRMVCSIMKGDYIQALNEFIMVSDNVEIVDDDVEAYILFGVNLSAAAEHADTYIYFKKIWISYLLDQSRDEEAQVELDEFSQINLDDSDFSELRNQLSQKRL